METRSVRFRSVPHWIVFLLAACGSSPAPSPVLPDVPPPGRCADYRDGYRNVYYGDLHVHTRMSLDAYFFSGVNGPREAHRFARGEAVGLPAIGSDDPFTAGREARIDRPLDFVAITDHAEFIGGPAAVCDPTAGTQQLCDTLLGQRARADVVGIAAGDTSTLNQLIVSLGDALPSDYLLWGEIKRINDQEYEPCEYTSLHGYEYTPNELSQMVHRNVVFRGAADSVPDTVFSAGALTAALLPENGNDDWALFDHLQSACIDRPDCDVLTIAHNSNASDGRYFLGREANAGDFSVVGDLSGVPLGRKIPQTDIYYPMTEADARLRNNVEKSFEMMQHKGQSECAAGLEGRYLAADEELDPACGFEVWKSVCSGRPEDPPSCAEYCSGDPAVDPDFCGHKTYNTNGVDLCVTQGPDGSSRPAHGGGDTDNCSHPLDYYRNAMAEGMAIARTLGVNPYKLNVVGASDTHNGTPGAVAERGFNGHFGVIDDDPDEQLGLWLCDGGNEDPADPQRCSNRRFEEFSRAFNPGGITGVWAAENTRAEIWDAIERGESFATSGPRLRVRSVASWSPLPTDVCEQLAAGRETIGGGVAMGADLPPPPDTDAKPHFAVWAVQDPEGHALQAIDLVKGYLDAAGAPRVRTVDAVAATRRPVERPSQDCTVADDGHPDSLCARWTDENFDAARDAYWYARVREVPSCRWSAWMCKIEHPVDCGLLDPANGLFPKDSGLRGYEGCCAPIAGEPGSFHGKASFHTIEERAWTSPIWYEADG